MLREHSSLARCKRMYGKCDIAKYSMACVLSSPHKPLPRCAGVHAQIGHHSGSIDSHGLPACITIQPSKPDYGLMYQVTRFWIAL
jgi:hypothetical protein